VGHGCVARAAPGVHHQEWAVAPAHRIATAPLRPEGWPRRPRNEDDMAEIGKPRRVVTVPDREPVRIPDEPVVQPAPAPAPAQPVPAP